MALRWASCRMATNAASTMAILSHGEPRLVMLPYLLVSPLLW